MDQGSLFKWIYTNEGRKERKKERERDAIDDPRDSGTDIDAADVRVLYNLFLVPFLIISTWLLSV